MARSMSGLRGHSQGRGIEYHKQILQHDTFVAPDRCVAVKAPERMYHLTIWCSIKAPSHQAVGISRSTAQRKHAGPPTCNAARPRGRLISSTRSQKKQCPGNEGSLPESQAITLRTRAICQILHESARSVRLAGSPRDRTRHISSGIPYG
jgi:hypothetical protein